MNIFNEKLDEYYSLFLKRIELFKSNKILLMLSGGVDSMLLARLLLSLREDFDINFGAYHLNHKYRGDEADKDAEFVREFCDKNSIECFLYEKDISSIAKKNSLSFELCARNERRRDVLEISKKHSYNYIASAHHADDRVESILYNIVRGSGLNGLRGIEFISGKFIRPFIDLNKNEILEMALQLGLEYREDSTNTDTKFTRNLFRQEIIPLIKQVNPSFEKSLLNLSEQVIEEDKYLETIASDFLSENILQSKGCLQINLIEFNKLHKSLKKRILRQVIKKINGDLIDVYSGIIDEIIKLIQNENTGKYISYKGIRFEISRENLWIEKEKYIDSSEKELGIGVLEYAGQKFRVKSVSFGEALDYENKLISEYRGAKSYGFERNDYILIPESYLEKKIKFRRRNAGDYIYLEGMKGHKKKIKKFLIDLKLASSQKSELIFLTEGSEVLWVVGLAQKEKKLIRANKKNEKFLIIELLNL